MSIAEKSVVSMPSSSYQMSSQSHLNESVNDSVHKCSQYPYANASFRTLQMQMRSQKYCRNQIEPSSSQFISMETVPNKEISLRTAVGADSLSGGQGHTHCNCMLGCKTGKCKSQAPVQQSMPQ
ncbi:hypothetical protein Ddc_24049 [Ditylenchus destructor]|nr:hypothetical protein Ddc_24049 [Ditylenchus destructor]